MKKTAQLENDYLTCTCILGLGQGCENNPKCPAIRSLFPHPCVYEIITDIYIIIVLRYVFTLEILTICLNAV